jgi:Leucine-rich repeat (LRR) protein
LFEILKKYNNISSIKFIKCNIDNNILKNICSIINDKVQELDLFDNDIDDSGCVYLACWLPGHKNIRKLNLSGNKITHQGVINFILIAKPDIFTHLSIDFGQ